MEIDSYYNQRRDRLSYAVRDYLTDESLTAQDFYRDLVAEVQSWVDYHKKELKRASEVKDLLEGRFESNLKNEDKFYQEVCKSESISEGSSKDYEDFWQGIKVFNEEH
jgi:hypothetical protein